MSAASVAEPTLMTALVLIPARIVREAIGRKIFSKLRAGFEPESGGRFAKRQRDVLKSRGGVADDRQQAIKEQSDNSGGSADA